MAVVKIIHTEEHKTTLAIWCPGCDSPHNVGVFSNGGNDGWQFNGDYEKPTFHPSLEISVTSKKKIKTVLCHSFIKEGRIQFLNDSIHKLKGQTVDLPDYQLSYNKRYETNEE